MVDILKILKPKNNWPQTVDQAVAKLLFEMKTEDKEQLKQTPKDELILYHYGLGMYIRNSFGLWHGNNKLKTSCVKTIGKHDKDDFLFMNPDTCSGIIVEALWEKLQE